MSAIKRAFEEWEVNELHLWARGNRGIVHVCDSIARTGSPGDYVAAFACGKETTRFYVPELTTGYGARFTFRWRRCRACVAEMRRRAPALSQA